MHRGHTDSGNPRTGIKTDSWNASGDIAAVLPLLPMGTNVSSREWIVSIFSCG